MLFEPCIIYFIQIDKCFFSVDFSFKLSGRDALLLETRLIMSFSSSSVIFTFIVSYMFVVDFPELRSSILPISLFAVFSCHIHFDVCYEMV